jgi:hypothetical protein
MSDRPSISLTTFDPKVAGRARDERAAEAFDDPLLAW